MTFSIRSFQNRDIKFINARYPNKDIEGINLLNQQFGNPRSFLPKYLTITTQNGSFKFNIDMLKNMSPVIDRFLKSSFNFFKFQYNLNIKDETNVMSKFEQLCDGNAVTFCIADVLKMIEINQALELKCFPSPFCSSFLKSKKSKSSYLFTYKIILEKRSYLSFLQGIPQNFIIKTKKSNYECNSIGIHSSQIISKFIQDNPNVNIYTYDFEDENNEFQIVCDYMNYSLIKFTPTNYQIIKKISNELQIEFLNIEIDNFTNNYIYFTRIINEHRLSINSVEMLVKYLYNREGLSVESIRDFILHSIWSSEEKYVLELAAYMFQVIQQSIKSHGFLIDLITLLDQNETENIEIKKLKPFLIKTLLKNLHINNYVCFFVYKIYEKEMLSLEELTSSISKIYKKEIDTNRIKRYDMLSWFFPELIEANIFSMDYILFHLDEEHKRFVEFYYPSKIDEFYEMRKSGHPDDELTKALINDDVEKFQTILLNKSINSIVPYNIFEPNIVDHGMSIINYCAFYGSKKCFEYLLSKNAAISSSSEMYAIYNENYNIYELIKNKVQQSNPITPIIIQHKNYFIKNIHRQIYQSEDIDFQFYIMLIFKNGNIHSFIKFIEEGLNLYSLSIPQIKCMFSYSATFGFLTLTNLLIDLFFKNENNSKSKSFVNDPFNIIDIKDSTTFGNVSILKLYEPFITNKIKFHDQLIDAVKNEYYDILKYSFDSPFRRKIIFSSKDALDLIKQSFNNTSLNMFHYLKEKFVNEEKIIKDFPNPYDESILASACSSGNLKIVNIIFESMYQKNPKINCSNSFFTAASKKHDKICTFLLNKNANISLIKVFDNDSSFYLLKKRTISLLFDTVKIEEKENFIAEYLNKFISSYNYDVVEFLLEKNAPHNDVLFEAVKNSDKKMVSLILKYDSSPLFINRISEDGTALNIAVKSNYYIITKILLSTKGIDPSLYGKDYLTPLMSAFQNYNIDIINLLFDFYGEDIQTQTFQLNEILKFILKTLIDKEETKEDKLKEMNIKDEFLLFSINTLTDSKTSSDSCNKFSFGDKSSTLSKSTQNNIDKEISLIKKLLEVKNIDINYQYNNYSLLSYACKNNLIDIVSILIELKNCNLNQCSPIDGNSPLIIAIMHKNIEIINLLLKSPKININHSNYKQNTALTTAVINELPDIVDLIINDPRFDANENHLSYLFIHSNNSISQKLISNKNLNVNLFYKSMDDNSNDPLDNYKTILMKLVEEKNVEKIRMIIQHPTFDPNKSRVIESIFTSVKSNEVEIFRILLPLINNDVNIQLSNNNSLLTISVCHNNEEMVQEIINNPKFDPMKSMINEAFACLFKDKINENIRDMLLKADKYHLINLQKLLQDGKSYFTKSDNMSVECVNYLLNHGANPDSPDAFGVYPLQHAIRYFPSESIMTLINTKKIDLSRRFDTLFNATYLHLSSNRSDSQILKKLLEFDVVDINEIDDNGETPLIYAVRAKSIDNIKTLFERNDLEFLKRNNDGDDALSIAIDKVSSDFWNHSPKSKEDYLHFLLYYVPQQHIAFFIY